MKHRIGGGADGTKPYGVQALSPPASPLMSSSTHADPRVLRSQQRLQQALIALILERGYEAITVREITATAGVSYPTFFRHYTNKDALLLDVVGRSQAEMVSLLKLGSDDAPAQAGRIIFEHAGQNEHIYRVLLLDKGAQHLLAQVQQAAMREVAIYWTTAWGVDIPFEVVANHFVAGIIALLHWWLEHGRPYDPERMGQIYADLVFGPIQPLLAVRTAGSPNQLASTASS